MKLLTFRRIPRSNILRICDSLATGMANNEYFKV